MAEDDQRKQTGRAYQCPKCGAEGFIKKATTVVGDETIIRVTIECTRCACEFDVIAPTK